MSQQILEQLSAVLEQRKQQSSQDSYVSALYNKGLDSILKKVGEESAEVIIAAKSVAGSADKSELVYEVADLWFHTLILLAAENLSHNDVLKELARRFGTSGLVEKASRNKS